MSAAEWVAMGFAVLPVLIARLTAPDTAHRSNDE